MQTNLKDARKKINNEFPEISLKEDCSMGELCTFRAGGRAALMAEVSSVSQLRGMLRLLTELNVPHVFLGNGSNTLFREGTYPGCVIRFKPDSPEFFGLLEQSCEGEYVLLKAGAGMLMSVFSRAHALEGELMGFEALSGIPGSLGGAAFMNAGAYGTEMKDVVSSVHAVYPDGSGEADLSTEKLDYGYRHSALMDSGMIVTSVTLRLKKGKREEILAAMKDYSDRRNSKQPLKYPSAGSTFKRPAGHFAGALIEEAGLKGLTVGGAQVSTLHAGFVINLGGATAGDITELMALVQNTVYDKTGIMLEPEVRII